MKNEFITEPPLGVFAIETAAPTVRTIVEGRDSSGYGSSSADWRPFPQQELALAEYARQVVERFDFKAEVSEITTARDLGARRPGIILIDPWFIADPRGRAELESAVENLPSWVLPLLILDQPDDTRTRELADQVRDLLGAARALPTNSSRRAARGVSSLQAFLSIVRDLVMEAERQYLRHRGGQYRDAGVLSRPSRSRSSPHRPVRPGRPDSPPEPLGETPDA